MTALALRRRIPQLVPALEGSFRKHQSLLLQQLLDQYEFLNRQIATFETRMAWLPKYRRLVHRGKQRALLAVAHSLLQSS